MVHGGGHRSGGISFGSSNHRHRHHHYDTGGGLGVLQTAMALAMHAGHNRNHPNQNNDRNVGNQDGLIDSSTTDGIYYASNHHQQQDRTSSSSRSLQGWMGVSFFIWIVLMAISIPHHSVTLTSGETLPLPKPGKFSKNKYLLESYNVPFSVYYNLGSSSCPSLDDGNTITLQSQNVWTLQNYGDYQYDSFLLNAGSIVTATIQATSDGAVNVYTMETPWKHLGEESVSDDIFSSSPRYLSGGTSASIEARILSSSDSLSMATRYTMLYESASSSATTIQVDYTILATTYNLDALTPLCQNDYKCVMEDSKECVIVTTSNQNNDDDGGDDSSIEYTIQIEVPRQHLYILLCSAIPIVLGALLLQQQRRNSQKQEETTLQSAEVVSSTPYYESSSSSFAKEKTNHHPSNPPPLAPTYNNVTTMPSSAHPSPSAPPAEENIVPTAHPVPSAPPAYSNAYSNDNTSSYYGTPPAASLAPLEILTPPIIIPTVTGIPVITNPTTISTPQQPTTHPSYHP